MAEAGENISTERFTEGEWKLIQRQGARMGMVFGLVDLILVGTLAGVGNAMGLAWATQQSMLIVAMAATVPVCWVIGWFHERRLPAELRAKSRRIMRRTWWTIAVPVAVILGLCLLAIGRPVWFNWVVLAVVVGGLLAWMPVTRRVHVERAGRPAERAAS